MAKILIIEDDRAISDIERDYLELSGFEAGVAYDGVDGLNKARPAALTLSCSILCCRDLTALRYAKSCARSSIYLF